MGEIFDIYKRNKNPPNPSLCDNAITWYVNCCLNIVANRMRAVTSCAILVKYIKHYELCGLLC